MPEFWYCAVMTIVLVASAQSHGLVSETLVNFVALLSVATVIGVLTKFIRVPYTIALVLAGLAVALFHAAPADIAITEELVLVLFLPPLLFQAGLHLDLEHLQRKAAPVALLASVGVLINVFAIGVAISLFLPDAVVNEFGFWLPALLFGAMLAPTDPISVVATFRTTGAPEGLRTLVEGESLFNDGTGVVIFLVLVAAIFPAVSPGEMESERSTEQSMTMPAAHVQSSLDGELQPSVTPDEIVSVASQTNRPSISISSAVVEFFKVAGLGIIFGLGIGLLAFWLLSRLDDHMLENAITVLLVWGTFIIAEHIHVSGVIAVVVVGLIIGNHGSRLAMTERTRDTINTFWESIDFIINSILFLLIGIELQQIGGIEVLARPMTLVAITTVFIALMTSRAVGVYTMAGLLGRHWPRGWKHVTWWSGLKGSLTLAMVLGLPASSLREFLVPVAFGVVLVSLLLQGLTIPWLIRKVDLASEETVENGAVQTD